MAVSRFVPPYINIPPEKHMSEAAMPSPEPAAYVLDDIIQYFAGICNE
jgi:hypothetical protein